MNKIRTYYRLLRRGTGPAVSWLSTPRTAKVNTTPVPNKLNVCVYPSPDRAKPTNANTTTTTQQRASTDIPDFTDT